MNRCKKWNNALSGLANTIEQAGVKTNGHNFNEEKKVIDKFCKKEKIEGSFSERVLQVSEKYSDFKDYVKTIAKP